LKANERLHARRLSQHLLAVNAGISKRTTLRWNSSRFPRPIHGQTVVLQHRSMVFAARRSAGGGGRIEKIAWLSRLTGSKDTTRRTGLRGAGSMGTTWWGWPSWRGGTPHWRASKPGGSAREPLVRTAYHEGRRAAVPRARTCRDRSQSARCGLHTLRVRDGARLSVWWALPDCAHQMAVDTLTLSH